MQRLTTTMNYVLLLTLSVFLSACGGGGGGGTTGVTTAGTGTVTLLVTDGPSDHFTAVNVTAVRAELLSDDGKVEVYSGLKTFDLLKLETVTEIFSEKDVPAGTYNKIRLTLTEIELVLKDGSKEYPRLPGNGKLDLNPRDSFTVHAGARMFIQLDMDAEKSIKITRTGNRDVYRFRPVVFVKIVTDSHDTKLVRLEGYVDDLDAVNGNFDLCRIKAQGETLDDDFEDGNPYCVAINAAPADVSFFDSNGDPATFDTLANGDFVTAVGRFSFAGYNLAPSSHSSDDNSSDDNSSDDLSSDDDSSDDDGVRRLVLNAEVVWQDNEGNYDQFRGIARSEVTSDDVSIDTNVGPWFKFDTIPDQVACGGSDEVSIPVLVQDGTRVYDRQGNEVGAADIQPGVPTLVDGVCDEDKGGLGLKSAMITLDLRSIFQAQLVGVIASVEDDFSGLALVTEDEAVTDRCVVFNEGIQVFETAVEDNTASFQQRTVFSLAAGQQADVFGEENEVTGCLEADTIIYQEDEAVIQPI